MKPTLSKATTVSAPATPSLREALTRDKMIVETAKPAKAADVRAAAVLGKSKSLRAFKTSLGWK